MRVGGGTYFLELGLGLRHGCVECGVVGLLVFLGARAGAGAVKVRVESGQILQRNNV